MRFRLVPKSSTLNDLEQPKRTQSQKRCVFWSPLHPYYQQQKCRPMVLVSGNIRFMGILVGILMGILDSGVDDDSNFWRFEWLLLWNLQR